MSMSMSKLLWPSFWDMPINIGWLTTFLLDKPNLWVCSIGISNGRRGPLHEKFTQIRASKASTPFFASQGFDHAILGFLCNNFWIRMMGAMSLACHLLFNAWGVPKNKIKYIGLINPMHNMTQLMSCVHVLNIRFENKDFICRNLIASNRIWTAENNYSTK